MKKIIPPVLLVTLILISCKKNTDIVADDPIVYVAGQQADSVSGRSQSTVWKNGVPTTNQLSGNRSHYAQAIAVSGNDVYTTGFENQIGQWKCQVWKNGNFQYSLGSGYSYGNGIAVSGSDIYVTGGGYVSSPRNYSAMLWKNQSDASTTLASNSSEAVGNAIAISGTDVYVAGDDNNNATIWKNGTALTLNNAAGLPLSCLAIADGNVYAASSNGSLIRYWKNETPTDINITPGWYGFVNGIAVDGNDIYLCGWEYNGTVGIAKYWKNGIPVTISDGIRTARANAIAIKNNVIYIAGEVQGANNSSDYATVWKNGVPTTIGFINSRAFAIIVK
ncbi:MAG: hypothetical protein KA229_00360 [Chitinophagaceae bacterium]|nr:hypothetical protein [Chitinophagaceae bacterium]